MWSNTKCLVKISPFDEKGSLTCHTRVHNGSIGPIITNEKRDEMNFAYHIETFSGVGEDSAYYENSCNYHGESNL